MVFNEEIIITSGRNWK